MPFPMALVTQIKATEAMAVTIQLSEEKISVNGTFSSYFVPFSYFKIDIILNGSNIGAKLVSFPEKN